MTPRENLEALAARVRSLDGSLAAAMDREVERFVEAEKRHGDAPGHAWADTGAWDRTCARCGLRVRTMPTHFALERWDWYRASAFALSFRDDDPAPPCSDGDAGPLRTLRDVAPWRQH